MKAATIRLKEALELLDSGTPVAVRWVKYDRRRKTGGDFAELPAASLAGSKKRFKNSTLRRPTAAEESDADRAACEADGQALVPTHKNPKHFENATRNLVDTRTGKLVKVHIYLLVFVAARKVFI